MKQELQNKLTEIVSNPDLEQFICPMFDLGETAEIHGTMHEIATELDKCEMLLMSGHGKPEELWAVPKGIGLQGE